MKHTCLGYDPSCPCQDGDLCHYRGPNAWPLPRRYWVSCERFTVRVVCDGDGVIREAAPIVRRFVGQHLSRLTRWAADLGGLQVEVL